MTRKFRLTLTLLILFSSTRIFAAAAQSDWIIAAQKFTFTRNQTGSVADGVATMFPARILEKLSSNMYRNLQSDEKAARELYQLRQERNSLFLQLSSEIKKRDSLFLEKYSQSELNRKLVDADKKVQEIKDKLAANLEKQKSLSDISYEENQVLSTTQNQTAQNQTSEKISLYNNSITALFTPSTQAEEQGIKSAVFEKEVINAKINCLITGKITAYDEYIFLTVETYIFPGKKLAATITEIGTVDDADFLAESIVRQLSPVITNSMPVTIKINILSPQDNAKVKTYIDDVLYNNIDEEYIIDSGVHHIQFLADGYISAGTNYYFTGNKYYDINVNLDVEKEKTVFIASKKLIPGSFLINGEQTEPLSDGKSKITINGNVILGQFITEDNLSAFFYVPESKLYNQALYTAKLKPLDHSEYIEKYRKRMYVSYSVLVSSLVPAIITKGRLKSYVDLFNDSERIKLLKDQGILDQTFNDAKIWNTSAIVCTGISIAAGAWFVFELYRYFNAANSVLPSNTKINFEYEEPVVPEPVVPEEETNTTE